MNKRHLPYGGYRLSSPLPNTVGEKADLVIISDEITLSMRLCSHLIALHNMAPNRIIIDTDPVRWWKIESFIAAILGLTAFR
jgi:hypothetical protein